MGDWYLDKRTLKFCSFSGSRSIPNIFKSQSQPCRYRTQPKIAQPCGEEEFSEDSQSAYEEEVRDTPPPDHPFTLTAMMKKAADIKGTFSSAITELKADMLSISEKLEGVEAEGARWDKAITRLENVTDSHLAHLIEMNRQLEDLDNSGRRHNIRVRGIPESVEQGNISSAYNTYLMNSWNAKLTRRLTLKEATELYELDQLTKLPPGM